MADLYRKSSLERISNPEQLDKAIVVSSPMAWLALAGVAIAFIGVLIWAFIGQLPETITAVGYVVDSPDSWPANDAVNLRAGDFAVICLVDNEGYSKINSGTEKSESQIVYYKGDKKITCKGYVADKGYFIFDENSPDNPGKLIPSDDYYRAQCMVLCVCNGDRPDSGTSVTADIKIGFTRPIEKLPFKKSALQGAE